MPTENNITHTYHRSGAVLALLSFIGWVGIFRTEMRKSIALRDH